MALYRYKALNARGEMLDGQMEAASDGEVALRLPGDYVSVYVPTTPNPTSGFFLMMPRADVLPLAMSVDEALKYVISMGVVAPADRAAATPLPARN
jgi:uncharacterized membrane protein